MNRNTEPLYTVSLIECFTHSRGTQAMAAMLVFQKKKFIQILLHGDTNMAAMTSSANTL